MIAMAMRIGTDTLGMSFPPLQDGLYSRKNSSGGAWCRCRLSRSILEQILLVSDYAEFCAFRDGLAGDGTPDFALHQNVALGRERFHGRGLAAYQRIDSKPGFHAPSLQGQPDQEDSDGSESEAYADGAPGVGSEFRDGRRDQGEGS